VKGLKQPNLSGVAVEGTGEMKKRLFSLPSGKSTAYEGEKRVC